MNAPLIEHLSELRNRIMVALVTVFVVAVGLYCIKEPLLDFLVTPLADAQGGSATMISTGIGELFFVYIKLSFMGGVFITLPILLWQLWLFVAPGLYDNERKYVWPFLLATPLLFYLGGAFTFFFVMPVVVKFFFGFSTDVVQQLPAVREYLSFLTRMIFAFGFAFELPIFMLVLLKFGAINRSDVAKFRRYAYVIIFILAAFLTPPDPASQLLLAVPLVLLFELSYFSAVMLKIGDAKS